MGWGKCVCWSHVLLSFGIIYLDFLSFSRSFFVSSFFPVFFLSFFYLPFTVIGIDRGPRTTPHRQLFPLFHPFSDKADRRSSTTLSSEGNSAAAFRSAQYNFGERVKEKTEANLHRFSTFITYFLLFVWSVERVNELFFCWTQFFLIIGIYSIRAVSYSPASSPSMTFITLQ